jgi:hypothetical protein
MALLQVGGEAAGETGAGRGDFAPGTPGISTALREPGLGSAPAAPRLAATGAGWMGNDVERQAAQPVAGEFHRNAGKGLSFKVSTHLRSRARTTVLRNSAEVAEGR